MPSIVTIYGADIEIKFSQVIQSSLTQCYHVNKEFLVECILKENARSCVTPTGYLFCCNDIYIRCIVHHSTSDTCYFVLTYENEQFCLSGPFNLNSLVKKVNDVYRLDDCISDGKQNISYSLFCSSAVSNEERKNIVRTFKSMQKKRDIYNKYNDHYSHLEPAKKKQRYSWMDRAKKDELLETGTKKYKQMDTSKKKQSLKNRRKKYKQMDVSQKKKLLNKIAEHSRKRYYSMDCKKKEKHLHTKKNQLAIARQTRKISKLNVDICISQFCQKIKQGPYYVCTVCHRMLYRKSALIFNKQKYVNCNIQNIFTDKLSFDNKEYICKTCHSKIIKGKVPCQALYNDMFVDDTPTELSSLEKLEQILIAQRIVFEKIVVMPKGQQRKIKGAS